jgi:hypothetical protein
MNSSKKKSRLNKTSWYCKLVWQAATSVPIRCRLQPLGGGGEEEEEEEEEEKEKGENGKVSFRI